MLLIEIKKSFKSFNDAFSSHKAEKEKQYAEKYDNGEPVEIQIPVNLGFSHVTGEMRQEKRKFIIDNKLDIRKKLNNIVFIDMSVIERDKTEHAKEPSYAIKTSGNQTIGSIPEYLHDLPKGTRKKPGAAPEDLRRSAYV